jgi:hypothetical protein
MGLESFEQAVGHMFGRSVMEDCGGSGEVAIIRRKTSAPRTVKQWESRMRGLKKGFADASLRTVEFIPLKSARKEAQAMAEALISALRTPLLKRCSGCVMN